MLTIIRGLPGSGKSTMAQAMCNRHEYGELIHIEADMYFLEDGEYKFDPSKIKEAHEWCRSMTREYLARSEDVVVSNTFTQLWEMLPYLEMCKEFNIPYVVLTAKGDFGNLHGVPEEVIVRMKARWEEFS